MKNFIRMYDVVLTTQGPLFIGNGQEIKKKEYIHRKREKEVVIPRLETMYSDICFMNRQREFEQFLLTENKLGLGDWLEQNRIPESYVNRWKQYGLGCGDALMKRRAPIQIMACIKDSYGKPYIPGSSLKGMLRTILLAYDIKCNPGKYSRVKNEVYQETERYIDRKPKRDQYLRDEAKEVEKLAFHKLSRTERQSDMVNDIMSGIIVSDSVPLSTDDLVLCQKLEYHTDGTEHSLNLLRECIKPETKIHFQLTIDTDICSITEQEINAAIKSFAEVYYERFIQVFPNMDRPSEHTVWLGGGAGYISKTVVYPMFGQQAPKVVSRIFQNTGVPNKHKHSNDVQLGVSPHILKLTQYQGKKYQFGMCDIRLVEKT